MTLPPGRTRSFTTPASIGSWLAIITIGTLDVAARAACVAPVVLAMMTCTSSATNSFAQRSMRSGSNTPKRYAMS